MPLPLPLGALQALGAALAFGLSTPVAKALGAVIDPWLLAGLLYAGSGLGLAAVLAVDRLRGGPAGEAKLRKADLPRLGGAVLVGGAVAPVLLVQGLATTSGTAASLLLNLESVLTLAIAWTVLREGADRRLVLGAAAILAGALALSWSPAAPFAFDGGALLVGAACLCWAVDNTLTRGLAAADPRQIACVKGLVAGAANVALALTQGAPLPAALPATAALGVGFVGYGVSLVLFVLALRHVGAARTGAYFGVAPFVGALAAVLLLGEPVTAQVVAAAALMAGGVWLHLTERHDHEHLHEPLAHAHRHVHDEHHAHAHGPEDPPGEPHAHWHEHGRHLHRHPHFPDLHHRHGH